MAAIFGRAAGYDDGVALTGGDLVVAPGAAIRLRCFVRLHATHIEAVIRVVGELVVDHRRCDD